MENKIYRVFIGLSEEEEELIADALEYDIEETEELCIDKNISIKGQGDFYNINYKIERVSPKLNDVSLNIVVSSENEGKEMASCTNIYNKENILSMYGVKKLISMRKDNSIFFINIESDYDKTDFEYEEKKRQFYMSEAHSLSDRIKNGTKDVIENELIYRNFEKEEELALTTFCILSGAKKLTSLLELYVDKLNYVGIDIEDYYDKYETVDTKDIIKSKNSKEQLEFMINMINLIMKGVIPEGDYIKTIADDLFNSYIRNFDFE